MITLTRVAAGRLCEWVQRSKESAEEYGSFGEYQRVLELNCDKGQAAVLQWTPDAETPDLVYYQVSRFSYQTRRPRLEDSRRRPVRVRSRLRIKLRPRVERQPRHHETSAGRSLVIGEQWKVVSG